MGGKRCVQEKLMLRFSGPFQSRTEKIAAVLCLKSASQLPCKIYRLSLSRIRNEKHPNMMSSILCYVHSLIYI